MSDEARATRVAAIFIFPVKSCRGIAVPGAMIGARGFLWDREWMLVDANGRFLTQRVEPSMSLVEVALPPEALAVGERRPLPAGAALTLTAPGMETLRVPLEPPGHRKTVERVAVWKWGGPALDEGPVPAEWFSRYLKKAVRLVRFADQEEAWPTDPAYAPGFQISFTDGFPFMLASAASLQALNGRLPGEPLPINRFRPNLLVDGDQLQAFDEDSWHTFLVGSHTFHGVKPRARCKITTVNQFSGQVGDEPLTTLRTFRIGHILNPSRPDMKIWAYFAMNCVCEESLKPGSGAAVRVGDSVQVVRRVAEFGFKIADWPHT